MLQCSVSNRQNGERRGFRLEESVIGLAYYATVLIRNPEKILAYASLTGYRSRSGIGGSMAGTLQEEWLYIPKKPAGFMFPPTGAFGL